MIDSGNNCSVGKEPKSKQYVNIPNNETNITKLLLILLIKHLWLLSGIKGSWLNTSIDSGIMRYLTLLFFYR